MKTWINRKTIGGVVVGLVMVLIFFSKTIYTYNLPEVTAVKPNKGKLSKVEVGNGTVQWATVDSIYIPEEGNVGEIYVNEGEYIEAGKALFSMKYEMDENEWKLREIENSKKKFISEQRDTENKIQLANYPDAELLKAKQSLTVAKKNLEVAVALHEIGGVSTQELNEARNQLNYLKVKLDNLNAQEIENKQALQLQLEKIKLELENLSISEERYKKIQTVYNTEIVITAPQKGMILSSNISKGEKVQKDLLAVTMGTGNEYYLECPVSLENNFIATGDRCKLSNPSHQVEGVITSVGATEKNKNVRIRFTADDITAGETFEVLFQKQSETNYILVPNAAVCQDSNGYYLKQLKRRDGIMGKEYYLDRIDIYIGDSDSKNTVVVEGITFFEPILLYSNKTAVTGDVVLLKNAGDFFEE